MSDIFISYRREGGTDRAHLAYNILTQAGYDVFMDKYGIEDGKDFSQAIENDVKSCNDYLLILSKGMFQTRREDDYVLKEIKWALDAQKNIILLSPTESFWANEELPEGFPDFSKLNYCYLPQND